MATSVAALRQVLEAERVDDYPAAIDSAQKALDAIGAYPGGIDSLRDALDRCAEQDKLRLRELINKASVDHKVNGELIRIAMQKKRSAAGDCCPAVCRGHLLRSRPCTQRAGQPAVAQGLINPAGRLRPIF